jgi:excisionase family DNA binding protein
MGTLLSIHDICRLLSCHKTTIYRMVRAGKFPPSLKLSTQLRRWDPAAVETFLAERRASQ